MNRLGSIITAAVLFGSTAIGGVGTAVSPVSDFSQAENRSLAQLPAVEVLREDPSRFTAMLDEWTADHFVSREQIITAYTNYLLAAGKKNVRGLLTLEEGGGKSGDANEGVASDAPFAISSDYLFSPVFTVVRNRCGWLFENIDRVQKKHDADFVYIMVPEKVLSLAEASGGQLDEALCRENIDFIKAGAGDHHVKVIDICQRILSEYSPKERADMYYKTDFHWNELGAYRAAEIISMELAEEGCISAASIPTAADFYWRDLSGARTYMGDLSQRLTDQASDGEFIPFYMPADQSALRYYDSLNGSPVDRNTVIASGLEEPADVPLTYNTLSTYNLGYYRVENPAALEDKRVLILKDSMQNATTDFFTVMFKEVNIVDPRYDGPLFSDIMKQRNIDLVLFLYHENNVSTELMNYIKREPEGTVQP